MESPKKWLKLGIFILILALIIGIIWTKKKRIITIIPEQANQVEQQDTDYYEQLAEKLIMCESSGKDKAINLKDRDGTASFSYLQWKPETFKEYAIKYGIIGEKASWNYIMTIIWNRDINKYLVIQILKNEPEKVKFLWPVCSRKIK